MALRKYTVEDVLRLVVRRRWLVLLPFALGLAAAPVIAPYVPQKYRSETRILVIPQRVPDSYVKSTVTETIENRLPGIHEQILSRPRLERIITDLDLYPNERVRQVMEDVVQRMRSDITVEVEGRRIDSFRVAYLGQDAETARRVTERLASLYVEQNLRDRENQADSTSQFIEAELEQAKQRLVEHEKKLEDYRRRHAGQLPTQLQANLQAIQAANMQLQAVRESINRSLERRLFIERQIADAQVLLPAVVSPPAATPAAEAELGSTAQQLRVAEARLDAFLRRFTVDHPDVVRLQRTVGELRARLETEGPLGSSSEQGAVAEKSLSPAELTHEKRVRDLQAELAVLDHHVNGNRAEELRLQQVIVQYQAKVDVVPTRESELVELTRDYDTLQKAYETLLMKHEESKVAANLERQQIGEQFRILDPASTPQRPDEQMKRLAIVGSGAAAGLALGLLLIGVLESRDVSFRSEDEVLRALELPVLALIPAMASDSEREFTRRRSRLMDAAGLAAVLASIAVVIIWRQQIF